MNSMLPFRDVHCVLGLPFDLVTLADAGARLGQPLFAGGPAQILSTPNVNWVILARRDPALRESVLRSQLSVVDGTVLVWLGRAQGTPFRERVSGADLFGALGSSVRRLRVFFFGGLGDVAARAAAVLASRQPDLVGVGGCNPGQGSLADMSSRATLATVQATHPDLIVVSLGALRGQAWILRNRERLTGCWVTHLGAVVNFVAGRVQRAPAQVGRLGIEWLWRIAQEPHLWRRYAGDGWALLGLLATRWLPLQLFQALFRRSLAPPAWQAEPVHRNQARLSGAWQDTDARKLYQVLATLAAAQASTGPGVPLVAGETRLPLVLDLSRVRYLSPAAVGQLLVWRGELANRHGRELHLLAPSWRVRLLLYGHAADYLLAGFAVH